MAVQRVKAKVVLTIATSLPNLCVSHNEKLDRMSQLHRQAAVLHQAQVHADKHSHTYKRMLKQRAGTRSMLVPEQRIYIGNLYRVTQHTQCEHE